MTGSSHSTSPPVVRPVPNCACGHDCTGLAPDHACPECGERGVHTFRETKGVQGGRVVSIAAVIFALIALVVSILDMAGMIWAVHMVMTHYDPQIGLAFLYPALGYMFVVAPSVLIAFVLGLTGLVRSGGRKSPATTRSVIAILLSIAAAALPFLPLIVGSIF